MSEEDCFLRAVKKAMLALGLLALAMMSGCLPMAAPMALNVARVAVSGISSSARAGKSNQVAQDTKPCAMGERPLPRLIELRTTTWVRRRTGHSTWAGP